MNTHVRDDVEFREFKVKDVFKVKNLPMFDKNEVKEFGGIPYVTRATKDNGFSGYTKETEGRLVSAGNAITFGAETAKFYYQKQPFVSGNKMYALYHEKLNSRVALYLISLFEKATQHTFGYSNGLTGTKFLELSFEFPVTEKGNINWQYMEDYIADIERSYVELIDSYNRRDNLILDELHSGVDNVGIDEGVEFREFRLGDIFEVKPTEKLKINGNGYTKDDEVISPNGETPYIAAVSSNNGIKGYSNYPANNKGKVITLSTTADSSNTVFFQKTPFIGRQQMAKVYRKDGIELSDGVAMYIMSHLRKITAQFNYTNKLTVGKLLNYQLDLPSTPEGTPDWQYMEDYIVNIEERERESKTTPTTSAAHSSRINQEVVYKEYKIGDIFDTFLGVNISQDDMKDSGDYPVIAAINSNNGIRGFVDNGSFPKNKLFSNSLTVACRGQSGTTFWHSGDFVLGNNAIVLVKKDGVDLTQRQALYISTLIKKLGYGSDYSNYPTKEGIKQDKITLPTFSSGEIAWQIIEEEVCKYEELEERKIECYVNHKKKSFR